MLRVLWFWGLKSQRLRLGLTAIRRGFELYECLPVATATAVASIIVTVVCNLHTTVTKGKSSVATPSEHNPYRKELDDMLHDLNVLENIEQLTCQLRLRYEVLISSSFFLLFFVCNS